MTSSSSDDKERVLRSLDQLPIIMPRDAPTEGASPRVEPGPPIADDKVEGQESEEDISKPTGQVQDDEPVWTNATDRIKATAFTQWRQDVEDKINEREGRLDEREGRLDEREGRLDERERRLDERERRLNERTKNLAERENKLEAKQREDLEVFAAQEAEIRQRHEAAKRVQADLDGSRQEYREKFSAIAEDERKVVRERDELARREKEVCKEEERIEAMNRELSAFEQKVKEARDRVAEREEACADLERPLRNLEVELNETKKALKLAVQDRQKAREGHRRLAQEVNDAESKAQREKSRANKAGQRAAEAQSYADLLERERGSQVFQITEPELIEWLTDESHPEIEFALPAHATVHGSEPLSEEELTGYLYDWGCKAWDCDCELIIVGREQWTPQSLDQLVVEHRYPRIRIMSQEMLLASQITGKDMLEAPTAALQKFAEGHPALEYLIKAAFEWPFVTDWLPDEIRFFLSEGAEESPLTALGYHAGRTAGLTRTRRKNLLREAYHGEIPWVESDEYMNEWGQPRSRQRLWRMAHHLSRLVRNRNTNPSMQYAVEDWAEDLDWLEEEFYRPWMAFSWPSVTV